MLNLVCKNTYDTAITKWVSKHDCCHNTWTIEDDGTDVQSINTHVTGYGEVSCFTITNKKQKCVCHGEVCGEECCSEGKTCSSTEQGRKCCPIIDKSKCPNGETMIASNGCEICKCDSDTECPEGQKLVINYENGMACGEVCCSVNENKEVNSKFEDGGSSYQYEKGYEVVGAIDGSCCGGYTTTGIKGTYFSGSINEDGSKDYYTVSSGSTYSYSILTNGGVSYCAISGTAWDDTIGSGSFGYPTSGKYCSYPPKETGSSPYCYCSNVGDPQVNPSPCD